MTRLLRTLSLSLVIAAVSYPVAPCQAGIDFVDDDTLSCLSDADMDNLWAGGGTECAWINIDNLDAEMQLFNKQNDPSSLGSSVSVDVRAGARILQLFIYFSAGNYGFWATAVNTIVADTWMHVCVVYNSGATTNDPTFYINGVSSALGTDSNPAGGTVTSDAAETLVVGSALDGTLDDLFASTSALTAGQISQLYTSRVKRTALQLTPAGYWTLDDQAENTSADADLLRDQSGLGSTCTGSDGADNLNLTMVAGPGLSYP